MSATTESISHQSWDVIIIGAGVSGISAAISLVRANKKVLLLEATQHIGGRARSFRDPETGETIDNGQHVLMGCYHTTLDILRELGTHAHLHRQHALSVEFVDETGSKDILETHLLPGKLGVALGIARLRQLSWRDKFYALLFAARLQSGLARPRETETVAEYLKRFHQTDRTIARFWEPIVLATLNSQIVHAPAVLFVEVLRRAFFGSREDAQMLFPASGLSELFEPICSWLTARESAIFRSHSVESLIVQNISTNKNSSDAVFSENNRQFSTYSLRGVRTTSGTEFFAKNIILAVAPRAVDRILRASGLQDAIPAIVSELEFSPIISVYLWFDREPFDGSFCAMLGTTTQWIFNRRALTVVSEDIRGRFPGALALTISAGSDIAQKSNEEIVEHCLQEIHTAFPASRSASMLRWKVIKEKMATFQATPQNQPHRPHAHSLGIQGLALCGDWTQTHLPATIEGAAISGNKASEVVLRNLK